MLIQLIVFICGSEGAWGYSTWGWWVDKVDTDAETWLRCVHLHLSMPLVLLPFRFDFVDGLLEEDLKLGLRGKLLVVLLAGVLQESTLMLHHFPELIHHTVISMQFLLLCLYFAHGNVHKWSTLLIRGSSAQTCSRHMCRPSSCCRTKVGSPASHRGRSFTSCSDTRWDASKLGRSRIVEQFRLLNVVKVDLLLLTCFL